MSEPIVSLDEEAVRGELGGSSEEQPGTSSTRFSRRRPTAQ